MLGGKGRKRTTACTSPPRLRQTTPGLQVQSPLGERAAFAVSGAQVVGLPLLAPSAPPNGAHRALAFAPQSKSATLSTSKISPQYVNVLRCEEFPPENSREMCGDPLWHSVLSLVAWQGAHHGHTLEKPAQKAEDDERIDSEGETRAPRRIGRSPSLSQSWLCHGNSPHSSPAHCGGGNQPLNARLHKSSSLSCCVGVELSMPPFSTL